MVETAARLAPVDIRVDLKDGSIHVDGPVFRIRARVESQRELEELVESYFYALPPLLSLDMLDACIFSEVRGRLGDVSFCWGLLASATESLDATTREIQEQRLRSALSRLKLLDERDGLFNRRLLAAIQYFHIACRLAHAPGRPWEFLSESLLNYAKVLEALFPGGASGSIDAARTGLQSLGIDPAQIEALYVPALALRNAVDVAHPTLAAFDNHQLATLDAYASRAEAAFRRMLGLVFERIAEGTLVLAAPPDTKPSGATLKVLQRIAEALAGSGGDEPRTPGDSAV